MYINLKYVAWTRRNQCQHQHDEHDKWNFEYERTEYIYCGRDYRSSKKECFRICKISLKSKEGKIPCCWGFNIQFRVQEEGGSEIVTSKNRNKEWLTRVNRYALHQAMSLLTSVWHQHRLFERSTLIQIWTQMNGLIFMAISGYLRYPCCHSTL